MVASVDRAQIADCVYDVLWHNVREPEKVWRTVASRLGCSKREYLNALWLLIEQGDVELSKDYNLHLRGGV